MNGTEFSFVDPDESQIFETGRAAVASQVASLVPNMTFAPDADPGPRGARVFLPLLGCLLWASLLAPSAEAQGRAPREFVLASGLAERGLHGEAVSAFREFLKASPGHRLASEARYRLGSSLAELGRHEQAVVELNAAAADGELELRTECLFRLGRSLLALERNEPAAQRLEALLSQTPKDHYLRAAASYEAGRARAALGDDEKALGHFEGAGAADSTIDGYGFAAPYQAGFALLRLGRHQDAEKTFAELLQRFPQHPAAGELWTLRGESAARAGEHRQAVAHYRKAVGIGGPSDADARFGLGLAFRAVDEDEEAAKSLQSVIQKHPESPRAPLARLELARTWTALGRATDAVRLLEPLCRQDSPLRGQALRARGQALLDAGKPEEAKRDLDAALSLGDDPGLRFELGEACAERGEWTAALGHYRAAAEAKDDLLRGDALYAASVALHELGRHEDSSKNARELLRVAPQHPNAPFARWAICENLFALEEWEQARNAYDGLSGDHPDKPRGRFMAAWSSYLGGQIADSAQRFLKSSDDEDLDAASREEALSMAALAFLGAERADQALSAADRYRARYRNGQYLGRTERIAARVLKAQGRLRDAADRLRNAEAAVTADEKRDIALERADALFQDSDFEAARAAYQPLTDRDDRVAVRALEGVAWCSFELGDENASLEAIGKGLQSKGADAERKASLRDLRVHLHQKAERWGELEKAANEFLKAHAKDSRAPKIRYALGVSQARGGKPKAALRTLQGLRNSLDKGGEAPAGLREKALYEEAWAARRDDNEKVAIERFRLLATMAKVDDSVKALRDEALLHCGEADLESDKTELGRQLLAKVEGRYAARARMRLGQSLLEDGENTAAAAAFVDAMKRAKGTALESKARFAAGETLATTGQAEQAVSLLDAFLREEPTAENEDDRMRAALLLGESLVQVGRAADALGWLNAFLSESGDPGDDAVRRTERARAFLAQGRAHVERGAKKPAEISFLETVALSQGALGAEAQYRLGDLRRDNDDLAGAIDAFVRLSILYEDPVWLAKGLKGAADGYRALGRTGEAERFTKELIERCPDSDEAKAAKRRGGE